MTLTNIMEECQVKLRLKNVENRIREAFHNEICRCLDEMEKHGLQETCMYSSIFKNTPPYIRSEILAEFSDDDRGLYIHENTKMLRMFNKKEWRLYYHSLASLLTLVVAAVVVTLTK